MRQKYAGCFQPRYGGVRVLALEKISESVETSAIAWEKRDYWLKATASPRCGPGANTARCAG
jgi:hypothetical protein